VTGFLIHFWPSLGAKKEDETGGSKTSCNEVFVICICLEFCSNYKIEVEIGRECGTHGGEELCLKDLMGKLKEGDYIKDLIVCCRIILKRTVKKQDGRAWTGFVQELGSWQRGIEPSISIKCGKYIN
jgi:hypothetical protein